MADVLFMKPGHLNTIGLSSTEIDHLEKLNPHLTNFPIIPHYDLALLAPLDNGLVCKPKFHSIRNKYRALPPEARKGMYEILPHRNSGRILVAIDRLIEEHRLKDRANLVNAFVGGGAAAVATRSDKLIASMEKVEAAVHDYANASGGPERLLAKQRVNAAYKEFHNKFGPMLRHYAEREGMQEIHDRTIFKPNRAIKLVKRGLDSPLLSGPTGERILRVAKGIRWVAKGTVILDLGFRVDAVMNAANPQRQAFLESAGFGLSFYAVDAAAGIAVLMGLGPLGWFIAIVTMAALAYGADVVGKDIAAGIWDSAIGERKPLITWSPQAAR